MRLLQCLKVLNQNTRMSDCTWRHFAAANQHDFLPILTHNQILTQHRWVTATLNKSYTFFVTWMHNYYALLCIINVSMACDSYMSKRVKHQGQCAQWQSSTVCPSYVHTACSWSLWEQLQYIIKVQVKKYVSDYINVSGGQWPDIMWLVITALEPDCRPGSSLRLTLLQPGLHEIVPWNPITQLSGKCVWSQSEQ